MKVSKEDLRKARMIRLSDRVANSFTAGAEHYFEKLKAALKEIEYTPLEYAWDDPKKQREMENTRRQILALMDKMLSEMPIPVTYSVYGLDKPYKFTDEVTFIKTMGRLGIRLKGYNNNPRQKPSLQDQPVFQGLIGPMYDGPKNVRYETRGVYNQLSV